jgi:hypothetical protein
MLIAAYIKPNPAAPRCQAAKYGRKLHFHIQVINSWWLQKLSAVRTAGELKNMTHPVKNKPLSNEFLVTTYNSLIDCKAFY